MHHIFKSVKMVVLSIFCLSFMHANASIIPLTYTFLTDTPTSAIAVLQGGLESHITANPDTIEADFSLSITGTNWTTSIFFRLDLFSFEVEGEPGTFDEGASWSVSQVLGRHITNPHGDGEAPIASQMKIGTDILVEDDDGGIDVGDYAFEDIQGLNPETPVYVGAGNDDIVHIALDGPHKDFMNISLIDLDKNSQRFLGESVSSGGEISLTVKLTHNISEPPTKVPEPSTTLLLIIGLFIISIKVSLLNS